MSSTLAFAVAARFTVIVTASADGGHPPLEIVHVKVAEPTTSPVTPDVGEEAVIMVPTPAVSVQTPVPTVATLPPSVEVVTAHNVESDPALAVVGGGILLTIAAVKKSVSAVHPPASVTVTL